MLSAGKLDRRVVLKKAGESPGEDPFGNPLPAEDIEITVWAEFTPVSDSEKVAASEVIASLTARFRIRYSEQVAVLDPTWWIEFEGREFNIAGVKELTRRRGLEVTAAARAD